MLKQEYYYIVLRKMFWKSFCLYSYVNAIIQHYHYQYFVMLNTHAVSVVGGRVELLVNSDYRETEGRSAILILAPALQKRRQWEITPLFSQD